MSIFNIFKHKNDTIAEPEVDLAEKLYTLCLKCNDKHNTDDCCYDVYQDNLIRIVIDFTDYICIYLKESNKKVLAFDRASDDFGQLSSCKQEILNIIYNAINEREEKYITMCNEKTKREKLEAQQICKHLHELNGE